MRRIVGTAGVFERILFPILVFGAISVLFFACLPPEAKQVKTIRVGFTDEVTRRIYSLKDQLKRDSLYPYLHADDPTYRYYTAMAMASMGDSLVIDSLKGLLSDPVQEVRIAAAYALGQCRSSRGELPLLKAFDPWDSLGTSAALNAEILEAIGKCGQAAYLESMVTVSTYSPEDSVYQLGLARGIFQYALRGMVHPEGTRRMIEMVADQRRATSARLIAATYLARTPKITIDTLVPELVSLLKSEPDPSMRLMLALTVGKSGSELARTSLIGLYPLEKNVMVRCNMVRALSSFAYPEVKEALHAAFNDESAYVGIVASEVLMQIGDPKETPEWLILARSIQHPWVKANLYVAISRLCPVFLPATRTAVQADVRKAIEVTTEPYLKSVYIRAMGKFGWNFPFLYQLWQNSTQAYVKTTAMESIRDISDRPDFNTIFGVSARKVRKNLVEYFLEGVKSGDVGSMAVAAGALRLPEAGYRSLVHADSTFRKAMNLCQLPQEIETYNELGLTRAFLTGKSFTPNTPEFNHAINWTILERVKANTRAVIKLKEGNIILRFFPDEAPGSVVNFIELVESGFFTGKVFHRVVPNFVIQGGCPRGDGYGALSYTIRSELNRLSYDRPGRVGMASAGLNTEGTQFFITHSPTFHLDGRYSLFAEVESGQEVVDRTLPGDRIEEIEIIY